MLHTIGHSNKGLMQTEKKTFAQWVPTLYKIIAIIHTASHTLVGLPVMRKLRLKGLLLSQKIDHEL